MSEVHLLSESAHVLQPVYLKNYHAPIYFIDEIKLHIDLQEEQTIVKSTMLVRHSRLSRGATKDLILNGEELILESILLDGQSLPSSQYEVTDRHLIIRHVPDQFQLEIVTKIFPKNNTALCGLYQSRGTYCTQCEAEGFRRITYFLDHPDCLSRFTTTIVADKTKYPHLLSNGNLIESGAIGADQHYATWEDPYKKPAYLFALVAGDFDLLEDQFETVSNRLVALKIYVEKGYGDQAHFAMQALKKAMRWDEQAFGREYDLDIYMIVAISDFNMGAMENKGLNIFNTKYVLAKPETATDDDYIHILSVIGHEYFHNWSGNRVTCRDWFQLSLKEGLTIFRDQSFTEDLLSQAVMRIRDVTQLRETQFPEDAGPLAHPVRPDSYIEINNFYTATVYNKGAEILRMLQTILGKELFRKGMDLYFVRHDGHAVTIEDFVKSMEDVSGINLTQFRLWYSQAGTPVVRAQAEYDANKKIYTLTYHQSCPATPGQPNKKPMFIPIKISLFDPHGQVMPLSLIDEETANEKVLFLKEQKQTFRFKQVESLPIPSLLRNFSAPVILHYPYANEELLFLFKHDTDAFNRWEAGQQYSVRAMLQLIASIEKGESLKLPEEWLDMYRYGLLQPQNDPFLLAEMLLLPSEKYVGDQMVIVNVDGIHQAREFVRYTLAAELENLWLEIYQNNQTAIDATFLLANVGKRQLKNRCLSYLLALPGQLSLGMAQFKSALTRNMTDTQAALSGLVNWNSPFREEALADFYTQWQNDALVVDKWFAIQAASTLPDTLAQVKKLMHHPAFDLKNPNKVYSLIGTFGYRNPVHFHQRNGDGYAFLAQVVHELDHLNPQVAARMVKPLTDWRRYDKERQALMHKQLGWLLQDTALSRDLYELVSKSLE